LGAILGVPLGTPQTEDSRYMAIPRGGQMGAIWGPFGGHLGVRLGSFGVIWGISGVGSGHRGSIWGRSQDLGVDLRISGSISGSQMSDLTISGTISGSGGRSQDLGGRFGDLGVPIWGYPGNDPIWGCFGVPKRVVFGPQMAQYTENAKTRKTAVLA